MNEVAAHRTKKWGLFATSQGDSSSIRRCGPNGRHRWAPQAFDGIYKSPLRKPFFRVSAEVRGTAGLIQGSTVVSGHRSRPMPPISKGFDSGAVACS